MNDISIKHELAKVTIEKAGPLLSLQDLGRKGYGDLGVTVSGPADGHAAAWANYLLDNHPNCTLLEVPLGNAVFRFSASTKIAITGASCPIEINGKQHDSWKTFTVCAGDRLTIGAAKTGIYCYLAVANGFSAENVLGSTSMSLREKIGPNCGQAFVANDEVFYSPSPSSKRIQQVPAKFIPDYSNSLFLHVIPSYQYDIFSPSARKSFFQSSYSVSPNSNKMGIRLHGLPVPSGIEKFESEATTMGSIQIPGNGEPIVLMAEHQTIGGYPKIGVVAKLDCFQLSQRRAGQVIRFSQSSLHDEQQKFKAFCDFFSI